MIWRFRAVCKQGRKDDDWTAGGGAGGHVDDYGKSVDDLLIIIHEA